jgi:hypothetical protein
VYPFYWLLGLLGASAPLIIVLDIDFFRGGEQFVPLL